MSSTGGGLVGAAELPSIVCTAVLAKEGYCFRSNTQWSYLEGNRQMTKYLTEGLIAETADVNQKAQVGPDSMVGEGTRVGERSSVKKSVIGKHTVVGKNVKIVGSIIMDHCVIEDK
jgi:translation initiation factor eIF-2B subunit gamma